MGYYADFGFDMAIPAEKVEAAEKALIQHMEETGHWALTHAEEQTISFLFNESWGDNIAQEEKPNPLIALATLNSRGRVTFNEWTHKKWRSWEEDMLDVLAPFIEDGGTVTFKGEDYDCHEKWEFQDGTRNHIGHGVFELREVEDLRDKVARAERLLCEALERLPDPDSGLSEEIRQFILGPRRELTSTGA
jgi:hypothetical protein